MADCVLCELAENKDGVVFENDQLSLMLAPKPAASGHLLVVPKTHYPIMEQVPTEILAQLWTMASKATVGLFQAFQAGGTNVIVRNGPAAGQAWSHFALEVIPRSQNDGLNLMWQPRQLGEEEMSAVEQRVKEETAKLGAGGAGAEAATPAEEAKAKEVKGEEDYLVKQLERLP